ncbi:MAG: hypothetical protein IJL98_00300 [Lachnospiraceae bacterium]|nr:hypothetical protein [Lachnospiraceae bacterium]
MGLIHMNFLSKELGMPTDINVIIPTYARSDSTVGTERNPYVPGMKFQVLWLLHGGGGDYSDYLKYTNIQLYAEENRIAVVTVSGYNSSYENKDGAAHYMDYVTKELPEMCRAIFPFSEKREDNFIGGLSMGSGGAFKIAMLYPEQYGTALIMSGGSQPLTGEAVAFDAEAYVKRLGGFRLPLPDGRDKRGTADDAFFNAKRNIDEGRPLPEFFFAVGQDDFFLNSHRNCVKLTREMGYTVHESETPGFAHEWRFWDKTLDEALSKWLPLKRDYILPEK